MTLLYVPSRLPSKDTRIDALRSGKRYSTVYSRCNGTQADARRRARRAPPSFTPQHPLRPRVPSPSSAPPHVRFHLKERPTEREGGREGGKAGGRPLGALQLI